LKIYNNAFSNNFLQDIAMIQDARRQAHPTGGQNDPRYPVPDPTNPWLVRNNTVINNVFGSGGYFQLYALDKETNIPADSMNINIVGNLFNKRTTTANPSLIGWGGNADVIQSRFDTPVAMLSKNACWVNAQTASSMPLTSMALSILSATGVAMPLPADVAASVGQPTALKKLGPFN
jgi:hypothetical protein